MYNKWFVVAIFLVTFAVINAVEEQTEHEETETADRNTVQTPAQSRLNVGDLSIPSGLIALLANGGAVAAGILAVAALAMLIMPVFSIRMCSWFGNCDNPAYQAYSAAPNSVYQDYPGYTQQGTYNNPVYQKRSLEYVGPILKALGNAYDKYNRQLASKKA